MEKTTQTREKAGEAFARVRPEMRDLTAAALVEGARATFRWLLNRPRKAAEKEKKDV